MNKKENVRDLNIVEHACNETENCSISTSRTCVYHKYERCFCLFTPKNISH